MMKRMILFFVSFLAATASFCSDTFYPSEGILRIPVLDVDGVDVHVRLKHVQGEEFKLVAAHKLTPIVGSWIKGSSQHLVLATFLPDGRYIVFDESCPPGSEYGTYSYDVEGETLSPTGVTSDDNLDCGLYDEGREMGEIVVELSDGIARFHNGGEIEIFYRAVGK